MQSCIDLDGIGDLIPIPTSKSTVTHKTIPTPVSQRLINPPEKATNEGSYECNICLEMAKGPVVTQCGHLFCWVCIYKWSQQPRSHVECSCPVCKSAFSNSTLTPIYSKGTKDPRALPGFPLRPTGTRQEPQPRVVEQRPT